MSGLFYYKNTVSIDKYPMRVYIIPYIEDTP